MLYGMKPQIAKVVVGARFGALVVIARDVEGESLRRAVVRCDCGAVRNVYRCHLTAGRTASCGCQKSASISANRARHGHARRGARPAEYGIWKGIVARCCNPATPNFHRYGGRGITVCDRWRDDFAAFFADVGARPSAEHSIDRIDNERGYEPGNVMWSTRREQAANTRANVTLSVFGETLCVAVWARRFGLLAPTVHRRLSRGWSPERALTEAPAAVGFAVRKRAA